MLVAPYDAELFGHWWYEGPIFLDALMRQLCRPGSPVRPMAPAAYLERHPVNQVALPATSSWGDKGYGEFWLNSKNAWIYPHLHLMAERMTRLAAAYQAPDELTYRALNQAARELLLAQSSDWPFIIQTGTTVPYARRRLTQHINRFHRLLDDVEAGTIDADLLGELEWKDAIFPRVDYRIFAEAGTAERP